MALSCTHVDIKNQTWYGDKGDLGAVSFDTLSSSESHLTKTEWDLKRFGMVCTDAQNLADSKGVIEKLCHDSGECRYIVSPAGQRFFKHIEEMQNDARRREDSPYGSDF